MTTATKRKATAPATTTRAPATTTRPPKGQTVGYVRVSSVGQNDARQLDGITLDKTFTDKASGKDTERPQLQALLEFVREGDTVMVHSMDRLSRTLGDLERIVKDLSGRGVTVTFTTPPLTFPGKVGGQDTKDASVSMLMLQIMGAVAQFERALILERQREGIAIAKAKGGVYKGRKPSLDASGVAELQALVAQGIPKAQIAAKLRISRTTLYANL